MNSITKESIKEKRSPYFQFLKYLLLFLSCCGIIFHLVITIITNKIYSPTFPRTMLFFLIIMSTIIVIVHLFGIIYTFSENIFKIPIYGFLLITLALFYLAESHFQTEKLHHRLLIGAAGWCTLILVVTIKYNIVISRKSLPCPTEIRNYRLNSFTSQYRFNSLTSNDV